MAAAQIVINQTGAPAGSPSISRSDLALSVPVVLTNADNTSVRVWRWALIASPPGSNAVLTSTIGATTTFTPDIEGSYLVELQVNTGLSGERDRRIAAVETSGGLRFPVPGEGSEFNADGNTQGYGTDLDEILRDAVSGGGGGVSIDDGTTLVAGVTTIALDPAFFAVANGGGGIGEISMGEAAATSALVRAGGTAGPPAYLAASSDEVVMARRAGALGWHSITILVQQVPRWEVVRDFDFATVPEIDITSGGDGNKVLDDGATSLTFIAASTANANSNTGGAGVFRRDDDDVGDDTGFGLRIHHDASVSTSMGDSAASRTSPRLAIAIEDFIPSFDPFSDYVIMAHVTRLSASGSIGTAPHAELLIGDDAEGISSDRIAGASFVGNGSGATWEPTGRFSTLHSVRGAAYPTSNVIAFMFGTSLSVGAFHGTYGADWPDPSDLLPTAKTIPNGSNAAQTDLWNEPTGLLMLGLGSRASYTGTAQVMFRRLRALRRTR